MGSFSVARDRRAFVRAVLAREVLRDAALALHRRGLPLVPLKGVLFQQLLYHQPEERQLTDIDVLVREGDFYVAIAALRVAGFEPQQVTRSGIGMTLRSPRGMILDLHRRLFSRARYRLSTELIFARARRDVELLGAPVDLAHPHDIAAHLVGKMVSDHVVHERLPRLTELLRWVKHQRLDPTELAAHLQAHGLGRAARYVLACGTALLGDDFFRQVTEALPADPLGTACARVARTLIPRWEGTPLAAVPAHLLNASLPRAAASMVFVAAQRWRQPRPPCHVAPGPGLPGERSSPR
ncbi:MAG: hypothetical protein RL685_3473 [Pseudomonadota bacterium]|jgi:hypothetical protein